MLLLALGVVGCKPQAATHKDIGHSSDYGSTPSNSTTDGPTTDEPPDPTTPTQAEPVCLVTDSSVLCPYQTLTLRISGQDREVHYQTPNTPAPKDGFPVAIVFQGSFFTAEYNWDASDQDPFGAYHQAVTTAALLDAGFAVLTPETKLNGSTFWDTNVPPYNFFWESSDDHELMLGIFEAAVDGIFGPVQTDQWFATGMSSGGYMTSRLALAYPGRFRALVVVAASYATCSGVVCLVGDIPDDHPPTLFIHGDDDLVVPKWTMDLYYEALLDQGIEADTLIGPGVGHAWFEGSGDAIADWFLDR